jgi:hypothetical protein
MAHWRGCLLVLATAAVLVLSMACERNGSLSPTATSSATVTLTRGRPTQTPTATAPAPTPTCPPGVNPADCPFEPQPPLGRELATLSDLWAGRAEWVLESYDVGLPVGESDTIHRGGLEFWSYLHASYQSAGVVDQCGDPVPFPGCVTLWKSYDGGLHFQLEEPVCLFPCAECPCQPGDHTHSQQYPRVFVSDQSMYMVYEWSAGTVVRTSGDGVEWSGPSTVAGTGIWWGECEESERIGEHPNIYMDYDCLVGAPPGLYVDGSRLYVFVALGRAPGHMGCYVGEAEAGAAGLEKCSSNPLFGAEHGYGPVDLLGGAANEYFEFRTISSADVARVGDRYYMVYEGVRGPSSSTADYEDQYALGLARSTGLALDGSWERYPGNPIIDDVSGNVGIGHADLVIVGDATYLYTATSFDFPSAAGTRGRYVLVKKMEQ